MECVKNSLVPRYIQLQHSCVLQLVTSRRRCLAVVVSRSVEPVQWHRGPAMSVQWHRRHPDRYDFGAFDSSSVCCIGQQRRRIRMFNIDIVHIACSQDTLCIMLASDINQIKIVTIITYCKTQNLMACSGLTRGADVFSEILVFIKPVWLLMNSIETNYWYAWTWIELR